MWYHQESNRGHKDFQSFALPTELWHHSYMFQTLYRCFSFAVAKVRRFFNLPNVFMKKVHFFLNFCRIWGVGYSTLIVDMWNNYPICFGTYLIKILFNILNIN